jgi:hypothetical protein
LNKAHPICPETIVIFRPDWTNIGSCMQCSGARRSPKAGEAVPWDDNSTRRLPRWIRWSPNRVHPCRRFRIERPSAAQGVDGK